MHIGINIEFRWVDGLVNNLELKLLAKKTPRKTKSDIFLSCF